MCGRRPSSLGCSLGPASPAHSSVRARAHFAAPLGGGRRRRPGTRRVSPALGSGLSGSCVRTPSGRRRVCARRSASSARTVALRDGRRRRRRPGTRLAAAPRVRTASCAVHAALALSRGLSDGVPRPCSMAEPRPLAVPAEILSLRRSDYAMVTASALTAMAIVQALKCGAGPVSDAVRSARRARCTAPKNQKDSWPLPDLLVS